MRTRKARRRCARTRWTPSPPHAAWGQVGHADPARRRVLGRRRRCPALHPGAPRPSGRRSPAVRAHRPGRALRGKTALPAGGRPCRAQGCWPPRALPRTAGSCWPKSSHPAGGGAGPARGRSALPPGRNGRVQLAPIEHLILVDAKAPVSFFATPAKSYLVPDTCTVHELSAPGPGCRRPA